MPSNMTVASKDRSTLVTFMFRHNGLIHTRQVELPRVN